MQLGDALSINLLNVVEAPYSPKGICICTTKMDLIDTLLSVEKNLLWKYSFRDIDWRCSERKKKQKLQIRSGQSKKLTI